MFYSFLAHDIIPESSYYNYLHKTEDEHGVARPGIPLEKCIFPG